MDILCFGEPLVEFVQLENGLYQRSVGGDTSNAAIAAARQGAKVGYITALGADRFGDGIVDYWAAEGVSADHVVRKQNAPTGIYFVDPDPEGRHFTYYRAGSAASMMRPEDLPLAPIRSAKCLHLSGITLAVSDELRRCARTAIAIASEAGVPVSLDTNLRLKLWDVDTARAEIHSAMASAAIAVTSIDDSQHLTGLTDPADIAAFYHDLGPGIVLVTMGAEGCHLSAPGLSQIIPPAPAVAVDSTGAGDAFAGSFLAWWLETGDAILAAQRAAIVAAGAVSGYGAVDPIPHRAAVLDLHAHV